MPASTDQLHTHAVQAEKHLEQLATGVAQLGADEKAVKFLSAAADICRKIATGLAKNMRDEEPPAQAGEEQPQPQPQQPRSVGEATDRMVQ